MDYKILIIKEECIYYCNKMYFVYMCLGFVTQITNNISKYMLNRKNMIIPSIKCDSYEEKIIGTWNVTDCDTMDTISNTHVTSLFKLVLEGKCTYNNIHKYAYTLGKLCGTCYFWRNMPSNVYSKLIFKPSKLYSEW